MTLFRDLMIVISITLFTGNSLGQPRANQILAPGSPPLTQTMVNDVNSFFEWILDVSLTPGQRDSIKDSTINSWNTKNKTDMDTTLSLLDLQSKVAKADPASRNALRQQLQPEMVKILERSTDETSTMLVAAYGAAHGDTGDRDTLPIPGDPPLTRDVVDKSVRLYEWLLDAKFTEQQYKDYEKGLIATWRLNDPVLIASYIDVLKLHAQLGRKTQAERDSVRENFCTMYMEKMRQSPDLPEAKWALGIYYSAHTPIAKGNPPLTRQAADAYAEVMSFMINEVVGGDVLRADTAYKNELATSLAAQYERLAPARQMELSQMPIIWAGIRLAWPTLSEAQKMSYRKQWAPGVRALLPPEPKAEIKPVPKNSNATGRPTSSSSAAQALEDYRHHQKTRQWLSNLHKDYLYEHVLSPGWTYQKYSIW